VWEKMYQSNFEIVLRIVYIRLQRIKQKIQHDEEINIEVDEIPKFFEKKFEELVRYSRSDISKANHAKKFTRMLNSISKLCESGLSSETKFNIVLSELDLCGEKKTKEKQEKKNILPTIRNPRVVSWLLRRRLRISMAFGKRLLEVARKVCLFIGINCV